MSSNELTLEEQKELFERYEKEVLGVGYGPVMTFERFVEKELKTGAEK